MSNLTEIIRRRGLLREDEERRGFDPHPCMGHSYPLPHCPSRGAHSPHAGKVVVHGDTPKYACACGNAWPCKGYAEDQARLAELFKEEAA